MSANPTDLRLASTVLLVRDTGTRESGRSVEVFMERRHVETVFVGGAYVFPGGRVDPGDSIDAAHCTDLDEDRANRRLGLTAGGLAHYVAAIRECFEEAGVLLAYRAGALLDLGDPETSRRYEGLRKELNAGRTTIRAIAEREDLRLATDRIVYWSHWITPLGEPRRYDTRFFIAHAPPRQAAGHDDYELTSSAWVTPLEAIDRAHRGEWKIIFPTLMNLKALAAHPTADAAMAWAADQPIPLPANQPRVLGDRVVLPGDEGYDQAEPDFSKVDPDLLARSFAFSADRRG